MKTLREELSTVTICTCLRDGWMQAEDLRWLSHVEMDWDVSYFGNPKNITNYIILSLKLEEV